VANTVVLSVQDRVREHAVLQTLGFKSGLIGRLIVAEGLTLSLAGGIVGMIAAAALLKWGHFSLTNEGFSINFEPGLDVWLSGLALALVLGVTASLVPAWQASRRSIVESFRAV